MVVGIFLVLDQGNGEIFPELERETLEGAGELKSDDRRCVSQFGESGQRPFRGGGRFRYIGSLNIPRVSSYNGNLSELNYKKPSLRKLEASP